MAGRITALKYQKRNRNRVSVFVDDRFALGLPAIVAASLKPGQVLSDAELEALEAKGAIEEGYNRSLNYLSYRPRSRAEVVTYLRRRDMQEKQIDAVVERLEGVGLLDEVAFAEFWVENREKFRPRGLMGLRYELRSKGVSEAIIERVLVTVDVSDSAYRAASKKARQLSHLDRAMFIRKMVDYLARRGFEYELARETAHRYWVEQTESREDNHS
jgi:regulatory protein